MFHVMRCPDSEGGGKPATETAKPAADEYLDIPVKDEYSADEWRKYGAEQKFHVTDLTARTIGVTPYRDNVLSASQARKMLTDACTFLHQLVALTSGVLESFTAAQIRDVVGHDIALPACIIRGDHKVSVNETPPKPEQAPDRDGRKNPRGRKHPLVALIELAAKAAKLLEKIAGGLAPESMDREPLASRKQARTAELDARYAEIDQKREDSNNRLFR